MTEIARNTPVAKGSDAKGKREREKSTLVKILPTDRIAFDKQAALLRGFAAVYAANGKPVTNEQAGEALVPKLSGSTVSQTNGFFCDIGVLARSDKGGLLPSTELIEYNNACQWDESEAKTKLRPIFEKTWFYRCLIPRLQLASSLPQATCLSLLAAESKAIPEHNERLKNVINFLALVGVISITGGTVTLLQQAKPNANVHERGGAENNHKPPPPPTEEKPDEHTLYLDAGRKRSVTLRAPLSITRAEYERIVRWIEVSLIVDGKSNDQ